MAVFYSENSPTGPKATRNSGIDKLIPGMMIDSFQWDPCGYSANGIMDGGYYWNIHVTPESAFSYASFETNYPQGTLGAFSEHSHAFN